MMKSSPDRSFAFLTMRRFFAYGLAVLLWAGLTGRVHGAAKKFSMPPVLLIHGFKNNQRKMEPLARYLRQ